MTSPRFSASPGCFSHSTSVPASMSAPSEGMRNSLMALALAEQAARRGDDPIHLRDRCGFEMARIRDRRFGAAHARDRRVEIEERLFDDAHADLRRQAAAFPTLVDDD